MRTGDLSSGTDDMLLTKPSSPPLPTPPTATYQIPKSPIMGVMPMQPMPANVMSPDEMLRAYAERRNFGGAAPSSMMTGPAVPAPAMNYNGNGMRTLYAPTTPDATSVAPDMRKSFALTEASHYDEFEDPYTGTAQ